MKTSDTFGTLELEHYESSSGLEDDDGEAAFLAKIADTGRPRPFDYLNQIEMLVKPPNVDLRRAIEILEVDMKNEFVKPIPVRGSTPKRYIHMRNNLDQRLCGWP